MQYLAQHFSLQTYGIEPSAKAVALANQRGVEAIQGTADELPFESESFDFVIFGFCLYLCDRSDLFRIANEANRVLKENAWVIIQDFFATTPTAREYHHRPELQSYKMDYRKLFDWHPDYTCFSHEIHAHGGQAFTDESDEWVATSVIRKKSV